MDSGIATAMDQVWLGVRLLLLLAVANTAPLIAKRLLGSRWSWPLDAGKTFVDGRPVLGASKTYRGVAFALALCALAAPLLGVPTGAAALLAVGAMTGDAISSFVKRRLSIAPSGRAYGLDQVPEALLPLLLVQLTLEVPATVVLGVTLAFLLLEPPLALLTHRLGLRDQPY